MSYQQVNHQEHRTSPEWRECLTELSYFAWPEYCQMPTDAWDFAVWILKRQRNYHLTNDRITPGEFYSIQTAGHAFFCWLLTKDGSDWLLRMFGVEEVPIHHGYRYWFGGQPNHHGNTDAQLIGKETNSSVRIFIKHSFNRETISPAQVPGAINEMKQIMAKLYTNKSSTPKYPSEQMWHWVLGKMFQWFIEPVDKHLPTPKSDRINGSQWARQFMDPWSPADKMWSALEMTEKYRPRAYRVEQNGGVLWCGRTQIVAEPLDRFDAEEGAKAIRLGHISMSEGQLFNRVRDNYMCDSCGSVKCCVNKSKDRQGNGEQLCDHCFGTQVETGTRDTLDNCLYTECYECPNYTRSIDDLKNLKKKLDLEYRWPVKR